MQLGEWAPWLAGRHPSQFGACHPQALIIFHDRIGSKQAMTTIKTPSSTPFVDREQVEGGADKSTVSEQVRCGQRGTTSAAGMPNSARCGDECRGKP